VENLGQNLRFQSGGPLLDQPQAQMDMSQEASFGSWKEQRAAIELARPPGVVEERGREEEVGAEALVELRGLAAERGDPDRVLQQPSGPRVVVLLGGRQDAQARAKVGVLHEPCHEPVQARMYDLGGEEFEEAVELFHVALRFRDELGRIGLCRLERANLELKPVTEALDAAEHADGVTLAEALVEKLDVVPDAGLDLARGVDELERQVRTAGARAQALLTGNRVEPLDDAVLGQLCDRHAAILGPGTDGKLAAVPLLKPFRALRYDEGTAGPLDDLVAPPYDVVTPQGRETLLARSRWNAVRVVRPDDPEEAARELADWRQRGVLVREERPAVWLLEEEFTGPDDIRRIRRGLVARVRLSPYGDVVLPHEATFTAPKEARLRLLRATRVKPSPIFLLQHGTVPVPSGEPDLTAELDDVTSRLWRVDDPAEIERILAGVQSPLLIADGHHRYESALRFHEEDGADATAHVLAVLVSIADEGLEIFPTHRVTSGAVPELDGRFRQTPLGGPGEAAGALAAVSRDHPAFVLLRSDGAALVEGGEQDLDTALVDSLPLSGVEYTASAAEAEQAVASGRATAAFIVRPPTVQQVEEFARAGVRMPPKSTYFFPKLTSGLLFSPFDE
jgi:uncharacterized protein (DUF1015 family)